MAKTTNNITPSWGSIVPELFWTFRLACPSWICSSYEWIWGSRGAGTCLEAFHITFTSSVARFSAPDNRFSFVLYE